MITELNAHKHLGLIKAQVNLVLAKMKISSAGSFPSDLVSMLEQAETGLDELGKFLPEEKSQGYSSPPSEANKQEILNRLERRDWNIAQVSREMGITRRTLYKRLAAFGIERKKVPRLSKPIIK